MLKNAAIQPDEQKIFNSITQKSTEYIKYLTTDENALLHTFLNAYLARHDPHSSFFNSEEKAEFVADLSREELSFGFEIDVEEDDKFKISDLTPGGAAWNSKQIEIGDIIDQVELENGKKFIAGIDSNTDFWKAVLNSENKTVTFYITKSNNTKEIVKLTKAKAEVSENVITGYIFNVKKQKLGYVMLPSFYSENGGLGRNGCASDLAREILQLKKDSIEGLILDLRSNGGGFIHEALAIVGLFINEGVLAIKHEKGDKPRYLKDPNRGTVYDGKLMVLVNNNSASASELVASTLKHYNRAIIVGNSSYGKATMQSIVPLDSIKETQNKNTSYIKVTLGKLYGVNKKTIQGDGVQPDIILPNLMENISTKESDNTYYIKADSVNKNIEFVSHPPIDIAKLAKQSKARIDATKWQQTINTLADSLDYFICSNKIISLTEKSIFNWETSKDNFTKKLDTAKLFQYEPYTPKNTSLFNKFLVEHEMYRKPNSTKIEELKKDTRLYESLNILSDYINLH